MLHESPLTTGAAYVIAAACLLAGVSMILEPRHRNSREIGLITESASRTVKGLEAIAITLAGVALIVLFGVVLVSMIIDHLPRFVGPRVPVPTLGAFATWTIAGYALVSPFVDELPSVGETNETLVAFRTVVLAVSFFVLGLCFQLL